MAPTLSFLNLRDVKLVNLNVFFALPFIITGICVNEALIFGRNREIVGLTITALTVVCCFLAAVRVWRPLLLWPVLVVIALSTLAALVFSVLILGEDVVAVPEILERKRLTQNGTGTGWCEHPLNESLSQLCYSAWKDDVKSSLSLFFSNTMLGINTILIRPVSLPSS
jgi:hypothetical protein